MLFNLYFKKVLKNFLLSSGFENKKIEVLIYYYDIGLKDEFCSRRRGTKKDVLENGLFLKKRN